MEQKLEKNNLKMLKNNVLIKYRPEFWISRNIGEIIILQIIKKNKYEKLVKRNGVITFFC